MITGNPQIVATNGTYNIIKRGSSYAVLKDGEPIEKARNWKGKKLLTSFIVKGYKKVDPPKPYEVQNPIMVVATNGDGIIISNGLGYAYLKEPDDEIVWKDEKLLYTALSKGDFRKIEPEEYKGEVNLTKAMNSNLVKKKVPVHQENGKIHMAYRWVDPTTGQVQDNPGKQVKNEDEAYSNVSNNNTINHVITEDTVDEDEDALIWFNNDDDFFEDDLDQVPEHNADNPVEPIKEMDVFEGQVQDDFDDSIEIPDNWDDFDDFDNFSSPEEDKEFEDTLDSIKSSLEESMKYCDMDKYPELSSTIDSFVNLDSDSKRMIKSDFSLASSLSDYDSDQKKTLLRSLMYSYSLGRIASDNCSQILNSVEKHYLQDNLSKCDEVTSNRKQTIHNLNRINPSGNKWGIVASHPALLKFSVVQSLGKKNYETLKGMLSKGNLTVNFPSQNMDSIIENGYKSTSFVQAIHRTLPPELQGNEEVLQKNVDKYMSAVKDGMHGSDYDSYSSSFWNISGEDGDWVEYLQNKSRIEYQVTGANPMDMTQRPIYMAYNPSGKASGAASMFGDGVMRVHDDLLPQCTASSEDSFYVDGGSSPFVKDIDHLQDMYISKILKNASKDTFGDPLSLEGNSKEWVDCSSFTSAGSVSMVPIELHYHGKKLENNKDFIINGRV